MRSGHLAGKGEVHSEGWVPWQVGAGLRHEEVMSRRMKPWVSVTVLGEVGEGMPSVCSESG